MRARMSDVSNLEVMDAEQLLCKAARAWSWWHAHTSGCVEILGLQVGVSGCTFALFTFACATPRCNQ